MNIPFNKPYIPNRTFKYIRESINTGHISGNGQFTHRCHNHLRSQFGFPNVLLTNSGTDALEMAAILMDIQEGDQIIMPSFTFVSTANAFILRGANIEFIDSESNFPNMDADKIEERLSSRTKGIVPVHYAGAACDMDKIMRLAQSNECVVVEDAAQGIGSYYGQKPLGSIGHLGALSFHETKNIQCGEGGMISINDPNLQARAEVIWEKGTNRTAFSRGKVDKYNWVDIGSSYLPSDLVAAFLLSQLEQEKQITQKRVALWNAYASGLKSLEAEGYISIQKPPDKSTNNGHLFYILVESLQVRDDLIRFLKERGIFAVFHYQALHRSPYFKDKYKGPELPNADYFSDHLIRLPMFYDLTQDNQDYIVEHLYKFFKSDRNRS